MCAHVLVCGCRCGCKLGCGFGCGFVSGSGSGGGCHIVGLVDIVKQHSQHAHARTHARSHMSRRYNGRETRLNR